LIKRSNQARNDPEATQLRHALLVLINALSCVAADEAYLLTEEKESPKTNGMMVRSSGGAADSNGGSTRRRIVVTLNDLRKEYQQLLDKCSRIERGDFDFEMDEHGSDEDKDTPQGVNGIGNGDAMQM
jgi:nuclear pore complex protein Nup160